MTCRAHEPPATGCQIIGQQGTLAAGQLRSPVVSRFDSERGGEIGDYDDMMWEAGDEKQVAVKVFDDRGNELLVVKTLEGSG